MKIFFCLVVFSSLLACHSSPKNENATSLFEKVKVGMKFTDVLSIVGAPDTIVHLGVVMDTFSNQTKTDEWYYGPDQLIVIVNDTVNAVDLHARETQARIQHIMDSARAAEGK